MQGTSMEGAECVVKPSPDALWQKRNEAVQIRIERTRLPAKRMLHGNRERLDLGRISAHVHLTSIPNTGRRQTLVRKVR